ncbi:MAG TPA: hypothetical protein VMW67_04360 [Desulfobacteria bacterium]|nr:hypothetical protein [Desulfobacteria bacterium]
MAKAKSLLEKIWWVIPPVVVVFIFMPLQAYFQVRRYYLTPFDTGDVVNDWVSTLIFFFLTRLV